MDDFYSIELDCLHSQKAESITKPITTQQSVIIKILIENKQQ